MTGEHAQIALDQADEHSGIRCYTRGGNVPRAARRALRAWERYNSTGNRTELVELGGLSADSTASHEPAEEEIPSLARTVRYQGTPRRRHP